MEVSDENLTGLLKLKQVWEYIGWELSDKSLLALLNLCKIKANLKPKCELNDKILNGFLTVKVVW